ncbi:hypothetical protein G7Z17_g9648 [Cylindrodendrum hubeiense]|uniref:Uncharacterized protein n=1 Tax=Cylindrodendrum hubeiense TaxID=595255 RepID=A0A9P5GZ31_9HYPO|nr:hypothetical protein G7Z17_g9648 [Cylindrodendrum hubeiense]
MSSSTDTDTDTDNTDSSLSLSTAITKTDTATATELIAITAPFKQPRKCDSQWTRTSAVSTDDDDSTSTVAILVSNAVASCYPSGWDDVVYYSRFNFNPAVCPSDWVYYDMGDVVGQSTAYCCKSGYTRLTEDDYKILAAAAISTHECGRWTKNTEDQVTTDNTKTTPNTVPGQTLRVHQAWTISWAASDTSTLTPQLPTLTNASCLVIDYDEEFL